MHNPPDVSALIAEFQGFSERLEEVLTGRAVDWRWRPDQSEWSLGEVMCHLRDVEREVHQVRFRQIISSKDAFLPGEDADAWAAERLYWRQDGAKALAEFVSARRETVLLLSGVDDEALWDRYARHALFGQTSMHELLNLAVKHDRAHWNQIGTLLQER